MIMDSKLNDANRSRFIIKIINSFIFIMHVLLLTVINRCSDK